MMDDFFSRAIIAGVGVALVAGPLGCYIVWRRLAYFGDTLSHAALLGIALALLFQVNITLSVFLVSVFVSLALLILQRRVTLSADALLGLLAHSALAFGMVALSFMTWVRVDLMGFLFGDILAVTPFDIAIIWGGGLLVLIVLAIFWRSLFAATVNLELAQAEGMKPEQSNIIFMLLMAALIGVIAVFGGLFGSLQWDTPAGPSIVVAASIFFIITVVPTAIIEIVKSIRFNKVKNE